jgi:hypothetical protein
MNLQTKIGRLVHEDPKSARSILVTLFLRDGDLKKVAKSQGVHWTTVIRWINAIKAAGLQDPRVMRSGRTLEGVKGPRLQKSTLAARAVQAPARLRRELGPMLRPRDGEGARQARVRVGKHYGVNEITIRRVAEKLGLRDA